MDFYAPESRVTLTRKRVKRPLPEQYHDLSGSQISRSKYYKLGLHRLNCANDLNKSNNKLSYSDIDNFSRIEEDLVSQEHVVHEKVDVRKEINTLNELNLFLITWKEQYQVSNAGLLALLKALPKVKSDLLEVLPQTVNSLVSSVARLYDGEPDLIIQSACCKLPLHVKGKYITDTIGSSWYTLPRSKLIRKLSLHGFEDVLYNRHINIICKCETTLDFNTIKSSPFIWYYSTIETYIKKMYNEPVLVAQSLLIFYDCFPIQVQKSLLVVLDKRYRTYSELVQNDPSVATILHEYFLNLSSVSIRSIWEKTMHSCLNSNFINEAWHGKRFWEKLTESGFKFKSMWMIMLSLIFDWYSPYKFSSTQSLAPLIISALNYSRYEICLRPDIHLFSLGYIPTDYHLPAGEIQKYLLVFVEDFLSLRRQNLYAYNSLIDTHVYIYSIFGTIRADSPAAHQCLNMQSPGRALANCRRCTGVAETCFCGYHANFSVVKGKPDRDKESVVKQLEVLGEVELETRPLNIKDSFTKSTGYKGNCVFINIPEFNIVYDSIFEAMHQYLFNIVSDCPTSWILNNSKSSNIDYFVEGASNIKSVLANRFKLMSYIRGLTRRGSILLQHPNKLIADEWKVVTLLIILPLFRGLLKRNILRHFAQIYRFIKKIFKDHIVRTKLHKIQNIMDECHIGFIKIYGSCRYKHSTHTGLCHGIQDIVNHGHIKSQWTAISEGLSKDERKKLQYCNGKNINSSLSKLGFINNFNLNLTNNTLPGVQTKHSARNELQKKNWPNDLLDNIEIWYTNRGKEYIGLELLFQVLSNGESTPNDFICNMFINVLISTICVRGLDKLELYKTLIDLLNNRTLLKSKSKLDIMVHWAKLNNVRVEFTVYKNIRIGNINYYGYKKSKKKPVYNSNANYTTHGEWIELTKNNDHRIYGRIWRFFNFCFYKNNQYNQADFDSFVIVQLYDWLIGKNNKHGRDNDTFLRIAERIPIHNIGHFQNINSLIRKVVMQFIYNGVTDEVINNKYLVLPWYK